MRDFSSHDALMYSGVSFYENLLRRSAFSSSGLSERYFIVLGIQYTGGLPIMKQKAQFMQQGTNIPLFIVEYDQLICCEFICKGG